MNGYEEVLELMKLEGYEEDVLVYLRESKEVYREGLDNSRWWTNWEVVVKIDEKYFSYLDATADDRTAKEAGWTFDTSTITRVYPKQVMKTVYTAVPQPE